MLMENYRPIPGTRLDDLDTPCLLIDLEALEHNLRLIAETYRDSTCKMRAHIKNLKSPILAHMQIRAGGTVGGVCAAKVAEVEGMGEGGINDILIANQVVARDKIERLCALAKHADIKVAVDDPRNLQELSEVARAHGVTIGVVIEVDTSMHRAGVRQISQGVNLAKLAVTWPRISRVSPRWKAAHMPSCRTLTAICASFRSPPRSWAPSPAPHGQGSPLATWGCGR